MRFFKNRNVEYICEICKITPLGTVVPVS